MIIPYEKLSREALRGLIEEFVTREGTDSGYTQKTLDENVEMVMGQLEKGEAFIVYDEKTRTANIVSRSHLEQKPGMIGKKSGSSS